MAERSHRRVLAVVCVVLGGVPALGVLHGCSREKRLVEVFDVGPPGGPRGESEGYLWVNAGDEPPPGKGWKAVDFNTLTPEERERIR